ncbi:hypothetical protein D9615_007669 [Tricholomella constricta]|uniref:BAG domain-containing protein n=1 Tax=Tricholomella constricta TaxID=117010 RepID=A0A8H5H3K5_9AGAR|nr:hypothetical protein D9615_007669 [Tricholomella constricta]
MFGNPFLHSSYYNPSDSYNPYYGGLSRAQLRAAAQQRALEQQRAQQRLRRSQYLPDEDEDSDDGAYYDYSPREMLYLDGIKRQDALERRRREEEALTETRQEAARQEHLWREQEQSRREQLRQAHRQQQKQQAHKRPPPSPAPSPSPNSPSPPASPPTMQHMPSPPAQPALLHTDERRNEAARIIQKAFRIYWSLKTLRELERQFNALQSSYSLPSKIDFQGPDGIVSITPSDYSLPPDPSDTINIPKLAYNPTNYNFHSYIESLNRLILKLDGVESWKDAGVRKARGGVVGRVADEANRMEAYSRQVWAAYAAGSVKVKDVVGEKGDAMDEDTETVDSPCEDATKA